MNESLLLVDGKTGVVNVASVPKHSLFRYPGGKTWLVPTVLKWVKSFVRPCKTFVEPFAGGGIIGLSVAFSNLAEKVVLCEIDEGVGAVWETVLGENFQWLADKILSFKMNRSNVLSELSASPTSVRNLAFQTILRNRVQRGGILAPGASLVREGENGKGVASRWYPETLAGRIHAIHERRSQISFVRGDAFEFVPAYLRSARNAFFVDPPYTAGGKRAGSRLYAHNCISHSNLFALMARANGPVMLTYDDCSEVEELASLHGFGCAKLPMKNTHHRVMYELLITNNEALSYHERQKQLAGKLGALRHAQAVRLPLV